MSCRHEPRYPLPGAVPSQQAAAAACTIVDHHSALDKAPRAVTIPEGNRTLIDRAFWDKMGPIQRACVVAHERAHVVIGLDCPCESCADKVGGYMMRIWGYSDPAIREGFSSLRVPRERNLDGTHRDAAQGALQGAQKAVRGLAARGLTGTVSAAGIAAGDRRNVTALKEAVAKANAEVKRLELAVAAVNRRIPRATAQEKADAKAVLQKARDAAHALAQQLQESQGTVTAGAGPSKTVGQNLQAPSIPTPAHAGSDQPASVSPVTTGDTFNGTPAPPKSGAAVDTSTGGNVTSTSATPPEEATIPKSPEEKSAFFSEVKVQIVAGLVVAVLLTMILRQGA